MSRYCLRRAAFRTLSFSPSSCITTKPRTFTSISSRIQRSTTSRSSIVQIQKRWLADEAATTQSEPEADSAASTQDADNSIAQASEPAEPLAEPPKTEEQAAEAVESASTPTGTAQPDSTPNPEPSAFDQASRAAGQAASAAADTFSSAAETVAGSSGFSNRRGERPTPEPSKQVYIGNLFFDVRGEDLQKEFQRAGPVISSRVITDQRGLSKGFGYVEFEDAETAQKAIEMYNQQNFEGRRLTVQFAAPATERRGPPRQDKPPSTPTRTLFIGNMSFDMSDRDLNELFRQVKNVIDVRVAIDRRTGQPRGFAHADFTDIESAQRASEELRGKMVCGRQLRVDFSQSTGRAAVTAS